MSAEQDREHSVGKRVLIVEDDDIFMPVMNGYAFLDERSRDPSLASIPVVVISADPGAARRAAERRAAAALTKPVDHHGLLEVVGRYC